MRLLVISNDVVPGLGVPVAAPGLRANGIAEGLRSHGFEVELCVPADVIDALESAISAPPHGVTIVRPDDLLDHITLGGFEVVVFVNANLTPHLQPIPGVRFVYDMFAPKLLERLASATADETWEAQVAHKERALALADDVWVNGRRKLGYALGWLLRPGVEQWRTTFNKDAIVGSDVLSRLAVVEMPIALDSDLEPSLDGGIGTSAVGVAGYAQQWSQIEQVHQAHQAVVDAGLDLQVLLPRHWGAGDAPTPTSVFPAGATIIDGPLEFGAFARWAQSMGAMIDVFAPTAERYFAMITRTAVSLRLGVPVIHGVDSEVADIIRDYDAGWVVTGDDPTVWATIIAEVTDTETLQRKRAGALRASRERFDPAAALSAAAEHLRRG